MQTAAAIIVCLMAPVVGAAQASSGTAAHSEGSRPEVRKRKSGFYRTISFRFDIPDLVTDHQFAGQKNTFHVQYFYARTFRGAEFDPRGHAVSSETYPYFQIIRQEMIEFIRQYRPMDDFYEVFAQRIAEHIMNRYPQIARLELSVDIPAFAEVPIPRSVSVTLARH